MSDLTIVPASAEETKQAIASYSRQANSILDTLYSRFHTFKEQYWAGQDLPNAIIAVTGDMHNKKLAHYTPFNGYQIPHAIEFNYSFISLNWNDLKIVEVDRTLVDHVLLHEMIHLYQDTIMGEKFVTAQAAHGRSFRREAKRLGVEGRGRLMACPYPVKMPGAVRITTRTQDKQEPGPEQNTPKERPQRSNLLKDFDLTELLTEVRRKANTQLSPDNLKRFEKHFQAALTLLERDMTPNKLDGDASFEERLKLALDKSDADSIERRLYEGEQVPPLEIERAALSYRTKAERSVGHPNTIIATWLEIKLEEAQRTFNWENI